MDSLSINDLAKTIANELSKFSNEVVEKVDKSSAKVGKRALKALRERAPKKSGNYAKAWRMTTEIEFGQPNKRILYVKAPYSRLTHLLEHGHALRNGGRVKAFPHIRITEEEVIEEFIREVKEAIGG